MLSTFRFSPKQQEKTKTPSNFSERVFGGSNEDRTRYLIVANDALSQMSYGPVTLKYNNFILRKNQSNVICRDIN